MTKQDVMIADLKKEYQELEKEQTELMEEMTELELVNKTLIETIEALQRKLQDKDGLIGKLKDEVKNTDIEIKKRLLLNFLDKIMLKVLSDEDSQEIVKFIITEKKGVL